MWNVEWMRHRACWCESTELEEALRSARRSRSCVLRWSMATAAPLPEGASDAAAVHARRRLIVLVGGTVATSYVVENVHGEVGPRQR